MKRGTIVLTPYPFTDLSGQKVRPALVVSRSDRSGIVVGYNPIQLYTVNKAVEFVPYLSGILELDETSMTDQHWSVRKNKN